MKFKEHRTETLKTQEGVVMERRRAFVACPSSIFGIQQSYRVCRRNNAHQYRRQRLRHAVSMVIEDSSSDRQIPIENLMTEDSNHLDMPVIVDIGDDDIDDDNIVDIIGADFDVKTEKRKKIRKRTNDFVDEINVQPDTMLTSDADGQPPIDEDETTKFVRTAVRAADERKAADIVALRISKLTYIASFVIMATGKNSPQVRAIGNLIEDELAKKHGMEVRRRDGTANSGWLLLDCTYCRCRF